MAESALGFGLLSASPPAGADSVYADDFTAGLSPTAWQLISNTPLYSVDATAGALRFSKPADGSYASKHVGVEFQPRLRGDFDVAVDFRDASINRLDGSPGNQIELRVFVGSQLFVLVRSDEAGAGHNVHVWCDPPRVWFGTRSATGTSGRLRIARTGVRLRSWLDSQAVHEGDYNGADATIQLGLQNNGTRDATAVSFDNFTARAGQLLWPERFFEDRLDGPQFHPSLVDRGGMFALANGEARNTGPRHYVRTRFSDYNTLEFLAEVIYAMNGGGGAGGLFFGLGQADRDPAYYNEPLYSVFAIDHAQDFTTFQGTAVRALPASGQPQMLLNWAEAGTLSDGTNALRLIKRGDRLTWQMDHHYDAAAGFLPTYSDTFSLTNLPFLNATNSHLFFGTENSPTRILEYRVLPLAPELSVFRTATDTVMVSWPLAEAEGWVLQATNALPSVVAPWPIIPPPYQTNGANLQLIEPSPVGSKFYRLHKP